MTNTVGIIDYGAGNIRSVVNMLNFLDVSSTVISSAKTMFNCDRIILPGVGAAGNALRLIREKEFEIPLRERVINDKVPLLGICLGMHLLGTTLYENGYHKGLDFISGEAVSLEETCQKFNLPLPHTGWNMVNFLDNLPMVNSLKKCDYYYFSHSFILQPTHSNNIAALTEYGVNIVSAVHHKNIFATQFHPEKSQDAGEALIQAFLDWNP